jgi:AbiV family abortive infection protein
MNQEAESDGDDEGSVKFGLTHERAVLHFGRCLAHAKDLAAAAEVLLAQIGKHHIAFSLSVLAFEELGKAAMIGMASLTGTFNAEKANSLLRHLDDHEKKLFWAFWSPWGMRERIEIEKVAEFENIAANLHRGRLDATYVGPDLAMAPSATVSAESAASTHRLLKLQIEIAESAGITEAPREGREVLAWLVDAVDDEEKKPLIFGSASLAKRKELGNSFEWARWLKQQFDDARKQSDEFLARELARNPQASTEPWKPKWRVTVTLQSGSHTIRKNAFDIWNQHSKYLKLALDHNRREKDQLIAEIELPEIVGGGQVWYAGWEMAQTLILALNIGSLGLFWWEVPEKRTEYYKKIVDLETNSELKISIHPAPIVDFGHQAFTQETMHHVIRAYAALHTDRGTTWNETLKLYLDGLRIAAKTDIHLHGEASAFGMFARAFGAFLRDIERRGRSVHDAFEDLLGKLGMPEKDPERARRLLSLIVSAQDEAFRGSGIHLRDAMDMKLLLDWQLNDHLRSALDAEVAKEKESDRGENGLEKSS